MPQSSRGRRGSRLADGDLERCVEYNSEEKLASRGDESSGEDDTRKRRQKQRPMERKPTRKELRAVAPGGLLIDDVLQRIGFDDCLPDVDAFYALVDQSPPGQQKWCNSFCWTGTCHFANDCKYSHDGYRLRIWRRAAMLTPSRVIGITPLEEECLSNIRNSSALASVAFLVYDSQVVWGRDFGASNAEVWQTFVSTWRAAQQNSDRTNTNNSREGIIEQELVDNSDWMQLPDVVWMRIVQATPIEDLAAVVAALPWCVNWQDVIELYWPNQVPAALSVSTGCDTLQSSRIDPVQNTVSLCAASHAVAALLCWPQAAFAATASCNTGSSPANNPMHSPGFVTAQSSPDMPFQRHASDGLETAASMEHMCLAVQNLSAAARDPVSIPVETVVVPGGLRVDHSLVVFLCRGGSFRAIRRKDLKQVCGFSVREAVAFDFQDEFLVIGTCAPARLLAYDLSVPKPTKPSHQLRLDKLLDTGPNVDVACIYFIESHTFACGLQQEYRSCLCEANIFTCEGDSFLLLQKLGVDCLSPLNLQFMVVVSEGRISLWSYSSKTSELLSKIELRDACENCASLKLASGSSSRFVVFNDECRPCRSITVHDLQNLEQSPFLLDIGQHTSSAGQIDAVTGLEPPVLYRSHCSVRNLYLIGSLLLVFTESAGGIDLDHLSAAEQARGFDSVILSAWHLPTHRPLLLNHVTQSDITAFSGSSAIQGDRTVAFGMRQPTSREGRMAHCVLLLGSSATKVRTGRKTGLTGPQRHKISGSDARARRSGGMHKR